MGGPCRAKKSHIRFLSKTHFQLCALSYRPQGTHRKSFTWVHNCIPSAIQKHKSCIKILKHLSDMVSTISPVFGPHLKVWQVIVLLWNQLFEKNAIYLHIYNQRTNKLLWIFSILLVYGRSRAHKLCPSSFQKKSNFDLILKQMWRYLAT